MVSRFQMKALYAFMHNTEVKPAWRTLLYGNHARPRSVFVLWLAYNNRLPNDSSFLLLQSNERDMDPCATLDQHKS